MPWRRLPFERPRVLTAMIAGATATQFIRGSRSLSPAAKELVAGVASLAPAVVALRSSSSRRITVPSTSRSAPTSTDEPAEKEHERCGSHLLGPLLGTLAIGNIARDPRAEAVQGRRARPGVARRGRGLDRDLRVDGPPPRPPGREGAREAGSRAPAPARDRRADPGAARGRGSRAGCVPGAREHGLTPGPRVSAPRPGGLRPPGREDARRLLHRRLLQPRALGSPADGRHPRVVMQVFQKNHACVGGLDEAIAILKLCSHDWER